MILFDPALLEHVEEQRAHNAKLMETTAAMKDLDTTSEQGLAWLRDAMAPGGRFGMQALDFPTTREIPGPDGPIPIRVMIPEQEPQRGGFGVVGPGRNGSAESRRVRTCRSSR